MNAIELKEQLSKTYPYRIEMHAHTNPVSGCSEIPPKELAETYARKGFHGIILTNHFNLGYLGGRSKEEALKYYIGDYIQTKEEGEKHSLSVFLGAEIGFTERYNDYLLFGVDEDILSVCYDYLDKGLVRFREEVKLPNSVFVQAHPFRDGNLIADAALLDGIETFNMHPGHNSRVGIATRYAAEKQMKIKTVGTDYHHRGHEGVSALRCRTMPRDSFDIAKILRSGDYIFEVGETALVLP